MWKMKVEDILNKGKNIIDSNIKEYKFYYYAHKEIIEKSNDIDSSVEFELQYLKYLIQVENSYKDAIYQANQLLKLSNITPYSISKVYRLLGLVYNHTGEYVQAMEAYMASVKILNQLANKTNEQLYELGLNYNNISILYKNNEDPEDPEHYESIKRLEYIKLAETIFIEIESKKGLGIIYNSYSSYYISLKRFDIALKYQFKSLRIKEIEKDELGIAVNYGNISSIYLRCNKLDKAEEYLLLSKEIKLKNSNKYSICKLYLQLGNLYDNKLEPDKCKDSFLHALELAETHNLTFEIGEALTGLTEHFEKTKNYEQAFYYLNRNKIHKETLHDINKSKALVELKYKYEVEIKNAALSIKKQEYELMYAQILRNQMNPHFVYNTLNSISALIKMGNNLMAIAYLNKFSTLTRKIFEYNLMPFIKLREEINLCKDYLNLENLRFNNQINIKLKIKKELYDSNIPPMLIQPILENAVKHGLFHIMKIKKAILEVVISTIRIDNIEYMHIKINDNGIGTKKSIFDIFENNEKQGSLKVLAKRLSFLNNKIENYKIEFDSIPNIGTEVKILVQKNKI